MKCLHGRAARKYFRSEMNASQEDIQFTRAELEKILIGDHELRSLCREWTNSFLPDGPAAAPIICDNIIASLHDNAPISLLRVGDGEGNALGMTKGKIHPLQTTAFYARFIAQNGIAIPQDAAVTLCRDIRTALISADIVGFRSFRIDERALIQREIDNGDVYAASGILYARELLQQGLIEDYWRRATITSAWIHLDLIPHLDRILKAADSIIVISGRVELHDKFRSRLGARLEAFVTVPAEGFVPQSPEQSHFFNAFPIVLERLNRDLRGKLVLVGAGFFGKVYCHTAKLNGAVAIDLGSAFDILAGLRTRPAHRRYDTSALRWI